MNIIGELRALIVGVLVALVIGFGAGYYTKGKFDVADTVLVAKETRQETRQETARSIIESRKTDVAVETAVEKSTHAIDSIKTQIDLRLESKVTPKGDPSKETTNETIQCSATDWTLDLGTVSLFNATRERFGVIDAPVISNGEGTASSGLTGKDLADDDLDITKRYNDLAIRHNALVDYVDGLLKKQAQ